MILRSLRLDYFHLQGLYLLSDLTLYNRLTWQNKYTKKEILIPETHFCNVVAVNEGMADYI